MTYTTAPWGPAALRCDVISVYVILVVTLIVTSHSSPTGAVDLSQVDGKSLFQSLMASRCSVNCVTAKIRPVCGTDDVTYSSRCELKRAKKCDKKRIKVKHKDRCAGDPGPVSKCVTERKEAKEIARRQNSEVLIPTCKEDGTYNQIQCHTSTGYCWCVTRDGRHIPGTSTKDKRPRCKGKRKKRKGRGKNKRRKACTNKDRQTFNTALIKVFKEEYVRVNPTPPAVPAAGGTPDEFGTEKAIVVWKFDELDMNKDGKLKFKEIRKFGRMVKKLIPPRPCAKRFLKFCDKDGNRTIEKEEWTLCLGVDIKPGGIDSDSVEEQANAAREELLLSSQFLQAPDLQVLSTGPSTANAGSKGDRKESSQNCVEERAAALAYHSEEPNAKHFIPTCSSDGMWAKAQCHQSTGYCWCVKEDTGIPIPGTATYKVTPNCTFENEREMKGCPFEQKRRFLVDLIGDLTEERKQALLKVDNSSNIGPEGNLSLRETVARWKLKSLDANNNSILERKEWRPFRKTTLKNKNYPRKCRRSFLRYCDEDNNKRITYSEWKDCLGLNYNHFNSLPLNPKRKGKNPFVDQLT